MDEILTGKHIVARWYWKRATANMFTDADSSIPLVWQPVLAESMGDDYPQQ